MRNRGVAASWTCAGTPALSDPNSSTSSARKPASGRRTSPAVVNSISRAAAPHLPERRPIGVARHRGALGIIHSGTRQRAVAERETARFDHVDAEPETGGEAQDRADISGDLGLVERDPHGVAARPNGPVSQARQNRGWQSRETDAITAAASPGYMG